MPPRNEGTSKEPSMFKARAFQVAPKSVLFTKALDTFA